jgi:hypothetical protein
MTTNYAKLVEDYVKSAGSPADLYAGTLGATGASSALDWRLASINFIKAVTAVYEVTKRALPGPVSAIIASAGAISNLEQAGLDLNAYGYVKPSTRIALMGEVNAIGSLLGFAALAAGTATVGAVSAPVIIAVAGLMATVGIACTLISAERGVGEKQLEADLVKLAADAAAGLGKFADIKWASGGDDVVEILKNTSPLSYPIVELLHILSPSISVAEALKIVDASSSAGNTLQEAAATLNAIRKLITGQAPIAVSTPEQYLAALDATFNATAGTSVAAYTIKPWPSSASELVALAQGNSQVRAAMLLGTPFYITGLQSVPFSAAELSLYDSVTGQGSLTDKWLQDRSTYLGQLSEARTWTPP